MEELDLKELMSILWRKKIIIVFIVLLFSICGAVYSYNFVKPMYKSTTTIILGKVISSTGISSEFDGNQYQEGDMISQSDLSLNSSLIETYSELVKSKSLIEEVKNNLHINIETEELMKNISVSRVNNSDLLEVTAISSDPKNAKEIVSEVVRIFSDNVKEIYSISNVYVIDSADVPDMPYNVNHTKDIVIFTMIGIFLSMGYVLLYNIIDNTVKSSYEIENLIKSKTLITIPLNKKNKDELITVKESKAVISEAFRTLRTNIQFSSINTKGPKTLLITSCLPEEGKSYVSSNLAVTFAQAGKKVILVDSDMRRGRQAKIFNIPNANGLSNYISNLDNNGNELNWPLGRFIKETSVSNLNLITAGNVPPNPAELLESGRVIELVEELKKFYEIVIFDGAPLLPITDSLLIARILGNTMLVAVHNKTKKDNLIKAKKSVENVGGKIIGICLNKVLDMTGEYSDNYYYYAKSEKKSFNIKRKCKEKITNIFKKIKSLRKRLAEKNIQKEQNNIQRSEEERILAEQNEKDEAIFEEERAKEREEKEELAKQKEEARRLKEAEAIRRAEEKAKEDALMAEEKAKREAELARQREEERIRKEAEREKRQVEIAEEEARKAEEKAKRDAEIAKKKEEEKRLREEEFARKAEEKAKEDALMAEEKAKREEELAKQKEEEKRLKEEARKARAEEFEHKVNMLKGKVLAKKDKFVEDVTEKYELHKIKKEEKSKIRKEQKAIRDAEIAKIREEERIKREEIRAIIAKEREEKEAELAKQREEERKRKEDEALKKAEEAMQKAEEKAKRDAEEAKRKAEEEAKRAEERAKHEEELARKREEERRIKEEELAKKAEEDARRAEEKAKRDAEIAKQKEEEKRIKEEEAARRAEEAKLTDEYLQENLYPKTKYNKF